MLEATNIVIALMRRVTWLYVACVYSNVVICHCTCIIVYRLS